MLWIPYFSRKLMISPLVRKALKKFRVQQIDNSHLLLTSALVITSVISVIRQD